jgi:uncharacterized membrane protein HdeD (DUF308 family)
MKLTERWQDPSSREGGAMLADHVVSAIRHHWWLYLLRGIAALLFGVLTIAWPGATVVLLMAFIAAYALVDGLLALMYAFQLRESFPRWWVLLVQGVISVAFGVLAFLNPTLSLAYIVISVCLWMLVASVAQFMLARVHREMGGSPVWGIVGGIVTLALAVAAVVFPGLTFAAVVALVAWFALVIGVISLVIAFRTRALAHRPVPA